MFKNKRQKYPNPRLRNSFTRAGAGADIGQTSALPSLTMFQMTGQKQPPVQKGSPPIRDYQCPHLDRVFTDTSFIKKSDFSRTVSEPSMSKCLTIWLFMACSKWALLFFSNKGNDSALRVQTMSDSFRDDQCTWIQMLMNTFLKY